MQFLIGIVVGVFVWIWCSSQISLPDVPLFQPDRSVETQLILMRAQLDEIREAQALCCPGDSFKVGEKE
jgi:hypothetical protein